MSRSLYTILAVFFLLLSSCSRPSVFHENRTSEFRYLRKNSPDVLRFDADFSDTTVAYTLFLNARFDKGSKGTGLPLHVRFVSPSGGIFAEDVRLQTDFHQIAGYRHEHPDDNRIKIVATASYFDVEWEYRTHIRPEEPGEWRIDIGFPVPDRKRYTEDLLGIGISIEKTAQQP